VRERLTGNHGENQRTHAVIIFTSLGNNVIEHGAIGVRDAGAVRR